MLIPSEQAEYEYDAFISYRHNARDGEIAGRLHRTLETYRTPRYLVRRGIAPKLKKVFRDREELPTSGNLGESIERALAASRYLIVICSPEALESKWVLREVELFSALHGIEHVIPLLAAGEPDSAFPPGLIRQTLGDHGEVLETIEPLAADIRPREKRSAAALLRTEKLRLLAALLGCKFDELRQREQERRLRRTVTVSAAAVVFLLAFGAFTYKQLQDVSAARSVSVKNERIALQTQSRLYASMARAAVDGGDKLLGLSLAMEALPRNLDSPEKPLEEDAKNALHYASARRGAQGLTGFRAGDGASSVEDAKRCLTVGAGGDAALVTVGDTALRRYSMRTGRLTAGWQAGAGEVIVAVSSRADRAVTAALTAQGNVDVRLVDVTAGKALGMWAFHVGTSLDSIRAQGVRHYVTACFNEDGSLLFLACNQADNTGEGYSMDAERAGDMKLIDTATARTSYAVPGAYSAVNSALFLANGWLVVNFRNDPAIVLDPAAKAIVAHIDNANASGYNEEMGDHSVCVTQDGRFFLYKGMDMILHIQPLAGGEDKKSMMSARASATTGVWPCTLR